jgi:hypothetical protein
MGYTSVVTWGNAVQDLGVLVTARLTCGRV